MAVSRLGDDEVTLTRCATRSAYRGARLAGPVWDGLATKVFSMNEDAPQWVPPNLFPPAALHSPAALSRLLRPFLSFTRFVSARVWAFGLVAAGMILSMGCGTTRAYDATEQLVVSDAVDESVSQLDFRPLSGRRVYLDTSYLRYIKGEGFVNAEYVTSALRQQIVAAGCLIQDSSKDAELIIEPRLGTLGLDDHRVTFGVPENNGLASAAQFIPGIPQVPTIPEISIAKRESREAAAKVVAFAYDRETRVPVWQSGVGRSVATAKDTWFLGIGPFQGGTVREGTKLAGSKIGFGGRPNTGTKKAIFDRPPVDYTAETRFQDGWPLMDDGGSGPHLIGEAESEMERNRRKFADHGGAPPPSPIDSGGEMLDDETPARISGEPLQVAPAAHRR